MLDIQKIQKDFLFLQQKIHGNPVVFLDTVTSQGWSLMRWLSYTTIRQRPSGLYALSEQASEKYENTRKIVQNLLAPVEIILLGHN